MIGAILIGLLPSFLQVPLRKLIGQKIGRGSKVRFGTILNAKSVAIGDNVSVGPFCFIRAQNLKVGDSSSVKPLAFISTRLVSLGKYVHIAPLSVISSEFTLNSEIRIGDHSRIFPFCWLDTGEGIHIGNNVGIGGHSLVFTHGVWSDYLEGGPISYGPVTIKDNVWLPWRVFILPKVEIGESTIIGANSLVNKTLPGNVIAGGSPAKILRENYNAGISEEERTKRAMEILKGFSAYMEFKFNKKSVIKENGLSFSESTFLLDTPEGLKKGDMLILINKQVGEPELKELINKGVSILIHKSKTIKQGSKNEVTDTFISYIRRYGIRLYKE